MIPLFGPVPGGAELIVIFITAIMLFGIPLTIFGGLFLLYRRAGGSRATKEDVDELKNEVAELRTELEGTDEPERQERERDRERER
ncbi:hypothetical protein [Haladaptatus sp. T7]|uniref:hypothetical protein n=1 Tax=Haladaptatus sp. T7 TaxID=2029368 RepID=UPI0021A250CB|nr:hypothetical protein [Haladaptatus sp. T7]GKZ13648.1 hypothetical protein HAL_15290 [Haladaptatus sp. T7]